jgi:hypothetical protein
LTRCRSGRSKGGSDLTGPSQVDRSIQTSAIGDLGALLELRAVTVAEPESDIVYTTSSDPQLTVGYWPARTWLVQERAEAHSLEQEQPDR